MINFTFKKCNKKPVEMGCECDDELKSKIKADVEEKVKKEYRAECIKSVRRELMKKYSVGYEQHFIPSPFFREDVLLDKICADIVDCLGLVD